MKNIACAVRWLVLCVVVLSARSAYADEKQLYINASEYTGTLEISYQKNGMTAPWEHTYGEVFVDVYMGTHQRMHLGSLKSDRKSVRVEVPQSALQGGNQLPQIELRIVSGHLRVGQELQIINTRWVQ